MTAALAGLLLGLVGAACQASGTAPDRGAPEASELPTTPAAPAAPPAPPAPAYEGLWTGSYTVEKHTVKSEPPAGQMVAWIKDAGKEAVGQGRLAVAIDAQGQASGTASGPLGELRLVGQWSPRGLVAQLEPGGETPFGFAGTLVCPAVDDAVESCDLKAASRDGRLIRHGQVKLAKPGKPARAVPVATAGASEPVAVPTPEKPAF